MKKVILLVALLLLTLASFAHIGSPDIIYEGNAGPYKIQVTIKPPDVVPGTAQILVKLENQNNAKITLQPVYYEYGSEGAPDADIASNVPWESGLYQGKLWLMSFGSSSVKVSVEGAKGYGSTLVPVPAVATATRKMDSATGVVLCILGALLFAALISIIGACIGEATVMPGLTISRQRKRSVAIVMAVTAFLLVSGLAFAKKWWDAVELQYQKNMYKPLQINSSVEHGKLKLALTNPEWLSRKTADLVTDHGKLMHLFMVSADRKNFTHLHPLRTDTISFYSSLPPLPAGRYTLFAEVVHKDGMSETVTDTVTIAAKESNLPTDADDSWYAEGETKDDVTIVPEIPATIKVGQFVNLNFTIKSEGKDVVLQPYLGMAGHAAVMKEDQSVFIHLHPMGTISMAAQYAIAGKVDEKVTLCGALNDSLSAKFDTLGLADKHQVSLMRAQKPVLYNNHISFPYAFPSAGNYYVWVQVKEEDKIHTDRFEVRVE